MKQYETIPYNSLLTVEVCCSETMTKSQLVPPCSAQVQVILATGRPLLSVQDGSFTQLAKFSEIRTCQTNVKRETCERKFLISPSTNTNYTINIHKLGQKIWCRKCFRSPAMPALYHGAEPAATCANSVLQWSLCALENMLGIRCLWMVGGNDIPWHPQ